MKNSFQSVKIVQLSKSNKQTSATMTKISSTHKISQQKDSTPIKNWKIMIAGMTIANP